MLYYSEQEIIEICGGVVYVRSCSKECIHMGKPKKRTSPRATGARRSHLVLKLARAVNAKSPVKAYTTRREGGKKPVKA